MYRKLKNLICHPSCLGMYFLDQFHSIFGWLLLFFSITIVLLAGVDLGKKHLDNNTAVHISNHLLYSGLIDDANYSNYCLSGTYKQIETEYGIISFNDNAYMNNLNYDGIILVFGKDDVNMFYRTIHLGKKYYKDLKIIDFSINEIKNGDVSMRMAFEAFILSGISSGEANYRAVCYFSDLIQIVLFYLLATVLCYFASFLVNPPIERRFRIKIVLYSTIVYFMISWFMIMLDIYWLVYAGIAFAIFYTILAFSHIRQVKIERRG